jgi:hypothetical protein
LEPAQKNPILKDFATSQKWENYRFKKDGAEYMPIIPLLGSAAPDLPKVPWPSYSPEQLQELQKQIHHRACKLLPQLISSYIKNSKVVFLLRQAAKICEPRFITGRIMKVITNDLQKLRLYRKAF